MRNFRVDAPVRILTIRTGVISRVIAASSAVVVLLGWSREFYVFAYGPTTAFEFLRLFGVERSLTNWLQPILLVMAGLLLASIASLLKQDNDPNWRQWAALGCLFAFMSIDETINLDAAGIVTSDRFGAGNAVIMLSPFIVVSVALCGYFSRILFVVPRRYAYAFILSGTLLVGGAVGLEVASQFIAKDWGMGSKRYVVAASLEETFETAGSAVFCIALLGYLQQRLKSFGLIVEGA